MRRPVPVRWDVGGVRGSANSPPEPIPCPTSRPPVARRGRAVALLVGVAALAGCALPAAVGSGGTWGAEPGPEAGPHRAASIDHQVQFLPGLQAVQVRMCFAGLPPQALVAGRVSAASRLSEVFLEGPAGGTRRLEPKAGRVPLDGAGRDACVRYTVRLAGAVESRDGAFIVPTGAWLWRPPRDAWGELGTLRFRFALPQADMDLSLPWTRASEAAHHYETDARAYGFLSRALIGEFARRTFRAAGARFDVAMVGAASALSPVVTDWLGTAAQAVATVGSANRFPVPTMQVILLPSRFGDGPLGFGYVTRGGGAGVTLHVDPDAELAALRRDWTVVHEFSHLWMPFVARDDAWLSEGVATYLQEVLRVRLGVLPEPEAWRRLLDGADRGRGSRSSLARDSQAMYREYNFPKVYWGGASYALLADLEVRKRSHGRRSLGTALVALRALHAKTTRAVSAATLLADLDRLTGSSVFQKLAEQVVYRPPYPAPAAELARLGVVRRGGSVVVGQGGDARVRRALMRPL